jgi:hypothetical protein
MQTRRLILARPIRGPELFVNILGVRVLATVDLSAGYCFCNRELFGVLRKEVEPEKIDPEWKTVYISHAHNIIDNTQM